MPKAANELESGADVAGSYWIGQKVSWVAGVQKAVALKVKGGSCGLGREGKPLKCTALYNGVLRQAPAAT
jgi:hypothetical protein